MIGRRDFITLLGGAAAAWPVGALAQQPKRVGVLMGGAATETTSQSQLTIFVQGLGRLGWIEGQNLQIEVRWSAADLRLTEIYAADLVGLFQPDVLLGQATVNLAALQRATKTVPIVFIGVGDPVGQGIVPNLAHPGGNITGFSDPEFSIAGKWADLLRQMVPSIKRVALVFNPETSPQSKLYMSAIEAAAPSLGVEAMAVPVLSTTELEAALERLSHDPSIGLIFPTSAFTILRAKLIVEIVARYRLPAIYARDAFMAEGGLMQFSDDLAEQFRLAPFYVDRILRGTKPGDLPVHLPTKFKLTVNRKTAKALGIEVPLGIVLAADEVIE
jgi:putative ABC transport system substrate-binding protein